MLIVAILCAIFLASVLAASAVGFSTLIKSKVTALTANKELSFPLGLALFLNIILILGTLKLYSPILFIPLVLITTVIPLRTASRIPKINKKSLIWFLFPALYLLTRFFSASLPQQHSDPLYYHLLAPKLWAEWGAILLPEHHPDFSQATLWEALYGLPYLFLNLFKHITPLQKNITAQLTNQFLHIILGYLPCIYVTKKIFDHYVPKQLLPDATLYFLSWICCTLPALGWMIPLAKNDYILLLFLLSSFLAVKKERYFLAGIFMGTAYAVKIFAFWTGAALFIFIPLRFWGHYIVGGLLGCAPVVLRTLYFTGNPFFPALDNKIGPHWISSVWQKANETFAGPLRYDPVMWGWVKDKMFERALPKVILALGLIGLILRAIEEKKLHLKKELIFFTLQATIIFLLIRPLADGRYATPTVMLLLIPLLAQLLKAKPLRPYLQKKPLYALLLLALLINMPVETLYKIPKKYWFAQKDLYLTDYHPQYPLLKWINQNIPAQAKLYIPTEKLNYYLDRDFENVVEMKKWEDLLFSFNTLEDLVSYLSSQNYRYLHFYSTNSGAPYFMKYWNEILALRSKAVYDAQDSLIFEISDLRNPAIR